MRLRLEDLPPRMRRQAEEQIALQEVKKKKRDIKSTGPTSHEAKDFDSRGEWEYYTGEVLPKLQKGIISECKKHPSFVLYEKDVYQGQTLREIKYTPDFELLYADGRVEIVEIKSRFVRRMQRDYHIRRRIFIEKYARPFGWKFTEIITDEKKDEMKAWQEARERGAAGS